MIDDRLGVVILGCAHVPHAMSYARAVTSSRTARLIGVQDASTELASRVAEGTAARQTDDPAVLLTLPGVEAAIVCSSTVQHRALVEQAAAAGVHVLCEKPIATTVADGQAMIEACAAAGVQFHTAFVTRFYPLVERIRGIIAAGEIGEVVGMVGGNRGRPPLPPHYPAWITTEAEAGGGALIDHSVHVTDVMRHLSGREVVTVSAEVDDRMWTAGVDDMALLSLVFEGGIIASVDPSWTIPAGHPWDYDFYLRIIGTSGTLAISDVTESVQVVGETGRPGMVQVPFGVDIDAAMVEAFVASIRAGSRLEPCASGEDGLRALEIALAGYVSSRDGRTVSLRSAPDR
ncbi:MAG: Gfo/Idh/MocA family oxidoreductase [Chloroflexi bacterium]|nr:Gfo/Idh/MocA family oxidoreductase [Chloroflexota bacterium]